MVHPSEENFARLVGVVLGMGAYYTPADQSMNLGADSLKLLSNALVTKVERSFLQMMDKPDNEAVQICILLGTFFLFNGRPNAGLGILGSGVKLAQMLRLHREPKVQSPSNIDSESRRHTWWALEVFDK